MEMDVEKMAKSNKSRVDRMLRSQSDRNELV